MAYKFQFRRGQKVDLPELDNGEPGFTEDTNELYIGTPSGNKMLTFDADKHASLESQLAETMNKNEGLVNLLDFGGDVTGNTDSYAYFLEALTALNGITKKYLYIPPNATILLDYNGDINIPINVKIVSLGKATFILGKPNTRLVYELPTTISGDYSAMWRYCNVGFENIDIKGYGLKGERNVINAVYISKTLSAHFKNCQIQNVKKGFFLQNKDGLWTEGTKFENIKFNDADIHYHFDGNVSAVDGTAGVADGSFAYTEMNGCTHSLGEKTIEEVGILLTDNATFYGGNIHGYAWVRQQTGGVESKYIKSIGGRLNYTNLHLRGESFGKPTFFLHFTGGQFLYNKGFITGVSPEMLFYNDGTTSINNNAVTVTGVALQNGAGTTVYLGDQHPSIIINHFMKRRAIRTEVVHFNKTGLLTTSPVSSFIGLLPASERQYRIIKVEIGVGTAGISNPDGKWYFDIRKGFDSDSAILLGRTDLFIEDGLRSKVIHCDFPFSDQTWYNTPSVFLSTNASGKNTGTAPTDIYAVITYI